MATLPAPRPNPSTNLALLSLPLPRRFTRLARLVPLVLPFAVAAQQAGLPADPAADPAKEPTLTELSETSAIVSRTAHAREWAWVERVVDEHGTTNEPARGFTEIGTGACWWDGTAWQDTVPAFTVAKDGAGFVVERAATQVAVAVDIAVAGAVTVVTPEGRTLRSSPVLVAFTDRKSGESVRFAEVKSAQGELVEPNVVLWRDAVVDLAGRPLGDYRVVFTASTAVAHTVRTRCALSAWPTFSVQNTFFTN